MKFDGFDHAIDQKAWRETVQIPRRFFSIDGQRFVTVNLEQMKVPSDERGTSSLRIREGLDALSEQTRMAAASMLIAALDGKRKTSTVKRWLDALMNFTRHISQLLHDQKITTITTGMYVWFDQHKGASQVKILRGALLFWASTGAPGIQPELEAYLRATSPRAARGMIEVQNDEPTERPLSKAQVHALVSAVNQLYRTGVFDPQANLFWRLMISEALRPSQMRLLQFGDFKMEKDARGAVIAVRMKAPMVKQAGVPARSYMTEHRLSHAVSLAFLDHLAFVTQLAGQAPSNKWAVFGVRRSPCENGPSTYRSDAIEIQSLLQRSRPHLVKIAREFESDDLFNRRFKHTKLTHLASAGASLEVLAHAGYQTSTVSLQRYINLTEEAFAEIENLLDATHEEILSSFQGKVIDRSEATHPDQEHRIVGPSLDEDVGSCGQVPCGILACFGCYACDRFEAFDDAPHEQVEAALVAEQERARAAGLPAETIYRKAPILAGVRKVLQIIEERRN